MRSFTDRVSDIDISGIRKMFEAAGTDSINLGLGEPDFISVMQPSMRSGAGIQDTPRARAYWS